MNDLITAIKEVEQRTNTLGYALVETLNGNYVLKPLAKAEARGDSIEMEFWGPDMDSIKAQKREHIAQMKADGLL
jgi:myosin-crossreactive antigen